MKIGTELKPYTSGTGGRSIFMEQLAECNEQPADYSSMVLANTVKALTGTQSTTMDIPFVSSVKHTNLVTWEIRNRIELEQFFNEHNL